MKKFFALMLALVLCVGLAVTAGAEETGSCGPNATYTLNDAGLLTISGSGAISASIFRKRSDILSVVIEEGIKSIGGYAFASCSSLTSVSIPGSVTTIGSSAFYSCSSLATVRYGGTTPPALSGRSVFSGCTHLSTIYVPADYEDSKFAGVDVTPMSGSGGEEAPTTYSVNVTADPTAGGTVTGAGEYAEGDIVTLTATPAEGYLFKNWQVVSGSVEITDGKFVMGAANVEIKAVFEEKVNAATPEITAQPQSATYTEGMAASALTVAASVSDGGTLTYQWYENDQPIEDATGASYTPATDTVGEKSYCCVVTNTNEAATGDKTASVTSATATITVIAKVHAMAPVISMQPVSATYTEGVAASVLTVAASVSDGGTLTYQWYENNQPIEDATGASYTPAADTVGEKSYYCVVTNTNEAATGEKTASSTSATATITVIAKVHAMAPVITAQPVPAEYTKGAQALPLRVTAVSPDGGTLSYQWYENDRPIPGATEKTFTPPTDEVGEKTYHCVVTSTNPGTTGNQTAFAVSDAVKITVYVPAVVPQTGDNTPLMLLTLLMAVSLTGLTLTISRKRRTN